MSEMVIEAVSWEHRHGATLRIDHWQDAEVVHAERARRLAEIRSAWRSEGATPMTTTERKDPTAELRGKVVARVDYDYDDALRLHFTDGSVLYAVGVWHNDDTAGIDAALLGRDDPKSWNESRKFHDLVYERRWSA